jgi:hypothetical protein
MKIRNFIPIGPKCGTVMAILGVYRYGHEDREMSL